jgi:hypothetical protein
MKKPSPDQKYYEAKAVLMKGERLDLLKIWAEVEKDEELDPDKVKELQK